MLNNANNNKLDHAVKQTLTNYEAPYDATDWSKMENILNAAPKSTNFEWSYSLNIFIGVAILGGFYFLYNSMNSSKTPEKVNDSISQPAVESKVNVNHEPIVAPTPATSIPPAKVEPSANIVVLPNEEKITKAANPPIVKEDKIEKKANAEVEKINTKKENPVKEPKKRQVINSMGNEPIFGDMLDSSKGIVGKTKEKEETKKAAKTTQPNRIGWNSFISQNNLDSLKKYQAKQQDTLKE